MIIQHDGEPLVISLVGDIDDLNDDEFRASLADAVLTKPSTLVIDLRQAGHFGSHGVNSLVATWREVRVFGGDLAVVNPPRTIRNVLKACRVDELPGFVVEDRLGDSSETAAERHHDGLRTIQHAVLNSVMTRGAHPTPDGDGVRSDY